MSLDWKSIVRAIAPTLGTALGGPLAGGALKILSDKLLGKPDANESEISDYITSARPEDLVKLKEIEADYKLKMAEIGLDPLRLEVQDRASARDLFKVDAKPQRNITYLFLGGYFSILILFGVAILRGFDLKIPPEFALIFGVITAAIPQILSFWFGSSSSSAHKNALLAASQPPDVKG